MEDGQDFCCAGCLVVAQTCVFCRSAALPMFPAEKPQTSESTPAGADTCSLVSATSRRDALESPAQPAPSMRRTDTAAPKPRPLASSFSCSRVVLADCGCPFGTSQTPQNGVCASPRMKPAKVFVTSWALAAFIPSLAAKAGSAGGADIAFYVCATHPVAFQLIMPRVQGSRSTARTELSSR